MRVQNNIIQEKHNILFVRKTVVFCVLFFNWNDDLFYL